MERFLSILCLVVNAFNASDALWSLHSKLRSFRYLRESASARTKMNSFGQGTFTDNEIFRNRLAGIDVRESGHPKIIRNKIYGHESSGGYTYTIMAAQTWRRTTYITTPCRYSGKKKMWMKNTGGMTGGGISWEGVFMFLFLFCQAILVAHKCNQKVSEHTLQRRSSECHEGLN